MADYDYERLGDEAFQQLCQALLAREFQNVQCTPVSMPDGGRDAMVYDGDTRGAIVFQVKMNRAPGQTRNPTNWVREAIEGEREKIDRLSARGARQYIIVTNMPATSHLDNGRIDKIQRYLDSTLPIPALCWWREDLDRRLDSAYDLKLRYPALLNGPDVVRLLWETATSGEAAARRESALNAYIAHQYMRDSTVRFKQIELVSKSLFDLFVDVPATLANQEKSEEFWSRGENNDATRFNGAVYRSSVRADASDTDFVVTSHGRLLRETDGGLVEVPGAGAVATLTDPELMETAPWIVLEGAPGQGKSTFTQYYAQVQRVRILEKRVEEKKLSALLRNSPMAIPFRMDLRDLAVWLKGTDPWSAEEGIKHSKATTLEAALAGQVEKYSGGIAFDVADLHRILSTCPSLLLLDALDEVAVIDDRTAVIEAITEALGRLEGNRIVPQVIVTTRPTAISPSPMFGPEKFLHLTLAPIDESLAIDYCDRWAKAQRIPKEGALELRQTLMAKMRSAHIAELAKNTMQLSILLSLLHLRGASLPDKRTELYNAYFDIFLNRESEKSVIVRKNRDLLFDLHRYLGYSLHAEAERSRTNGRIPHDNLKQLLADYLRREGQSLDLLQPLFTGMVERFGALISRVEGSYEFEVQPLREYFAGRHLYDTAPYSPTGRESTGTKPDRFDGISSNPYWLNVTRFFGGCFSKGELADLADRVCDLIRDPVQKHRPYARSLAVALLRDWVFSQSPKATSQVVNAVFDDLGLQLAAAGRLTPEPAHRLGVLLPQGAGAEELAEICWERLCSEGATERGKLICMLITRLTSKSARFVRWSDELSKRVGVEKERWLKFGLWLGVMDEVRSRDLARLLELTSGGSSSTIALTFAEAGGSVNELTGIESVNAMRSVLDYPRSFVGGLQYFAPWYPPYVPPWHSAIALLGYLAYPANWIHLMRNRAPVLITQRQLTSALRRVPSSDAGHDLESAIRTSQKLWSLDIGHSLAPWSAAIKLLEGGWGRSWTSVELGVAAAAISNRHETGAAGRSLFDEAVHLPERIRYARRRAGDAAWWRSQLGGASGKYDFGLWVLAVCAWAKPEVILELAPSLGSCMESLDHESQASVVYAAQYTAVYRLRKRKRFSPSELRGCEMSVPLARLLFSRSNEAAQLELVQTRLSSDLGFPPSARYCLSVILQEVIRGRLPFAERTLDMIQRGLDCGGHTSYPYRAVREIKLEVIRGLADQILDESWRFPLPLVQLAMENLAARRRPVTPVMEIAELEGWFDS